jgi:hypothetical protein
MTKKHQISTIIPFGYDYNYKYSYQNYEKKEEYDWKGEKEFINTKKGVEGYLLSSYQRKVQVTIEYYTEKMVKPQPYLEGVSNPKDKYLHEKLEKKYYYTNILLNTLYFFKKC